MVNANVVRSFLIHNGVLIQGSVWRASQPHEVTTWRAGGGRGPYCRRVPCQPDPGAAQ